LKANQAFRVGLPLLWRTETDLRDLTFSLQSSGVPRRAVPARVSLALLPVDTAMCQVQMSDFLICSYPGPCRAALKKKQYGFCCLPGGSEHEAARGG